MREKYLALYHAMQSGVAYMMGKSEECSPKHLRVGVNSAMVEHGALIKLMIDKGIITMDEYEKYLVEFMEREVKSYEDQLGKALGSNIKLG